MTGQVEDKPEILDLMLKDMNSKSSLYQPTNFWSSYVKKMSSEIKSDGLCDFRRREKTLLHLIQATDVEPIDHALYLKEDLYSSYKLKLMKRLLGIFRFNLPKKLLYTVMHSFYGISIPELKSLFFQFAKSYGEANNAKPISNFSISKIANPKDVISMNGNDYTLATLNYYTMYAYCSRFCNFDSIESVAEIGSGSGKEAEVLKKLHPDLTLFLFDIPPALYVCERYLSALFPDLVIPYTETRKLKKIPKDVKGKIFIFGAWMISELEDLKYDLFWNSASFQEMEPNVVLNYLSFVNKQTKKFVFLNERMKGEEKVNSGQVGCLDPVTIEHYKKGLTNFKIQDMTNAPPMMRYMSLFQNSFWKKSN